MLHKISFALLIGLVLGACAHNPNKAEHLQTDLDHSESAGGGDRVGMKKGEMVVTNKAGMAERLRDLQNRVYSLEDKVYGTRKLGSLGLYGELKSCRRKIASRQYGGNGTLVWSEPLDRVTDKEDDLKIGLDEKSDLVGVSEEYLKARVSRFQAYDHILKKRQDDFENQISSCKAELASKELDADQPSRVMVQEASKVTADKSSVNQFMCGFVRQGAGLQSLMLNLFAKGWLSLVDFNLEQNLLAASLKDAKGVAKDNAMLFDGWKLAFDSGSVTVGQLLNEGKDAKLAAWAYGKKSEVTDAGKCLPAADGEWNR